MNLRKVDLNLLVIFDALMQEKNVTKAANRVALSQPAFSNALSRLRHYLKDDLFVRSPDGMLPTPRARELAPHISGVISILQSALEPGEFDPASDSKVFRISANDYLVATTITELMVRLNEEGPNLDVRVIDRGINPKKVYRALDTGEIDLAIAKTRSIDTLRTLTNQKHTYEGRVIEGEHINRRGVQAQVDKNAPYRDYKNSPERYFTTATDVKASTVRSKEILPFTNRQYLNRTLLGHARPQEGKTAEEKRPEVFKGLKQQLGVKFFEIINVLYTVLNIISNILDYFFG